MNKAFQTWSPRTRRFDYDSLLQDVGCQDTSGNKVFSSLPYIRICVFEHDLDPNSIFNKSDIVSYATGPTNTGDAMPWIQPWAAWVAATGIRVGKFPFVEPPSSALGAESSLFPTTKPSKLSLGFTSNGQIAIAIQRTETQIQIKWFRDGTGLNIGQFAFVGKEPALINNGMFFASDDPDETELVLYYVRTETPRTIYARFEHEDFANEYIINENLQTNVTQLQAIQVEGKRQVLYARDAFGRDVVLRTGEYANIADGDAGTLTHSIASGKYHKVAVIVPTPDTEANTLNCSIVSGVYADPIQEPASPLSGDAGTLTLSIASGEYV